MPTSNVWTCRKIIFLHCGMFVILLAVLLCQSSALTSDIDLNGFTAGAAGSTLYGSTGNAILGNSGNTAGDFNKDGFDDIVVSSQNINVIFVVFGRTSNFSLDMASFTTSSTNGFKITDCGFSASGAGDVNGDDYDDIVVGDIFADPFGRNNAGTAFVFFGHAGTVSDISATGFTTSDAIGFKIFGPADGYVVGLSVATAGDVNGDGFDDVMIDGKSQFETGQGYVIFGRASGFADIDLSSLVSTGDSRGYHISGKGDSMAGDSAGTVGDFNHDGYSDVYFNSPGDDGAYGWDGGTAFVIFGHSNDTAFPELNMYAFTSGTAGFKMTGAFSGDLMGWKGGYAGDLNGDGIDDMTIGSWRGVANGKAEAGMVYVIFGDAVTSSFTDIDLHDFVSGPKGFRIFGAAPFDSWGATTRYAGDVNGDGLDDLIVGSSRADPLDRNDAGSACVIYGHATDFIDIDLASFTSGVLGFRIFGAGAGDNMGNNIAGYAGDVNGDGYDDFLLSAVNADPFGRSNAGTVYLIYGTAPLTPPIPQQPLLPPAYLSSPTYKVCNGFAFAVVAANGSVHTWGESVHGGDSSSVYHLLTDHVTALASTRFSFAALKDDGSVVPWGASGAIRDLAAYPSGSYSLKFLVSNEGAYAGVDIVTGGVVAFGSKHLGGNVRDASRCSGCAQALASDVVNITASAGAFAALKVDGTVFVWGSRHTGADVSSAVLTSLANVRMVVATRSAFSVLLESGGVVAWGDKLGGGDTSSVSGQVSSGVVHLIATRSAFVAFKDDTGIVVWGYGEHGGDTSVVAAELSTNVTLVAHTFVAMAALKSDGTVAAWGRADAGGDCSAVQAQLVDVVALHGSSKAFAALTSTGRVVTWGKAAYGGQIPSNKVSALSSGVVSIYHTDRAFAALKSDGSVVVWGQAGHGGSPGAAVETHLVSAVHTICSNDAAFSVIKTDGSVVGWGHPVSIPTAGVLFTSAALSAPVLCA